MSGFVLVHGGVEGAWVWEPLLGHLQGRPGVDAVVAVDLPGFGERRMEHHEEVTLQDSVDTVVDTVHQLDLVDVVLVGHVMGAITVISAAPALAARLRRIVLFAGMAPFEGTTADDMLNLHFDGGPSQRERHAATPEAELYSTDEMDPATAAWLMARVVPPEGRPRRPPRSAVYPSRLPPGVPLTYVVQARDRSVPPDVQRRLTANLPRPPDEMIELDAPRHPMVVMPEATAALLLRYA